MDLRGRAVILGMFGEMKLSWYLVEGGNLRGRIVVLRRMRRD